MLARRDKAASSITSLAVLLWLGFSAIQPCYANSVVPTPGNSPTCVVLVLVCSPIIELIVIVIALRGKIREGAKRSRLYIPVLAINMFTVMVTQVLVWNMGMWLLAELLPVLVEFAFLRWLFNSLDRDGFIIERISSWRVFTLVLLANLVTFVLGLLYLVLSSFFM